MKGRTISLGILASAAAAGAALYYLQVYGFYSDATAQVGEVRLVGRQAETPQPINARDIVAIDAESSPIRFRACFSTSETLSALTQTHVAIDGIDPRNAPGWFDCFDASAIAAELQAGTARTFLSEKNIYFGVDRIVAVTEDGRGYIWHELNDCGEKAYDGTVVGEACPERDPS